MTASQNVLFAGDSPPGNEDHPVGYGIAVALERGLRERGLVPSRPDNWRDAGWSLDVRVGDAELQIALAQTVEAKLWMLQVASVEPQPGFFARLRGKRGPDRTAEVFDVARAVHEVLGQSGFTEIRWCLDGYPDDGPSSPDPPAPAKA